MIAIRGARVVVLLVETRVGGRLIRLVERLFGRLRYLPLEAVSTRHDLPRLLNGLGLKGQGAEIGVREGIYSAHILRHWHCRLLISVDPWLEDDPDTYRDVANRPQAEQEALYAETKRRLRQFGKRSEVWRKTSADAAPLVPDGTLDFVYIDARHDEASVTEDLHLWWPKIRPGGVIAGHDYLDGEFPVWGTFGVRTAVDRFFGELDLVVHVTTADQPSWIVRKP